MKADEIKKNDRWVIAQRWSHVCFLSFKCDFDQLRQKVPSVLEVDTFEGAAWLSIVPFRMSHIRFPFTPALPMSSLWELNLRTYVRYKQQAGIYFFTLDTDSWLGHVIAKTFFHLPYRWRTMNGQASETHYTFEAPGSFQLQAGLGTGVENDALDTWLVERYHLFTTSAKHLYRGDALHAPWQLRQLDSLSYADHLSAEFGFDSGTDVRARYAEPLDVRFRSFVKLTH